MNGVEVARFETGLGWYEATARGPAPHLRPYVDRYWSFEERAVAPVRRIEVPYPAVIVVVNFDGRVRVALAEDSSAAAEEHQTFVAGIGERAARTEHDGHVRGVELALSPIGARMVFGTPMHELAGRAVPLEALLGAHAPLLVERLHDAAAAHAQFALLDDVLTRRLAEATEPPPEIAWSWRRLVDSAGRLGVGRLSEVTGWSRKRLASAFREHVGLTPKTFARVLRFGRTVDLIRGDRRDWGRLALDCGYYDQAHFNRDFRAFAGVTPSEFVRRLSPDDPGVRAD